MTSDLATFIDPHDFWQGNEEITYSGSPLPEGTSQRRMVVTWTPPRARAAGPLILEGAKRISPLVDSELALLRHYDACKLFKTDEAPCH